MGTQYKNILLWSLLPTSFGAATYFTLWFEPNAHWLYALFAFGTIGAILFRKHLICFLVACFFFGFGYAGIYANNQDIKILNHDIHGINITGTVLENQFSNDKQRLHLSSPEFGEIYLSTADNITINIGDTISGTGGIFKPKPADVPHGFDFARHAYFSGISGNGYINDIKITYTAESGVYSTKEFIKSRANSFLTDTLVLGDKKALPKSHRKIWATNGMAHIWSISGYHITLIAGWLFIIFYFIFRLCPPLVRRIPARIPAMVCSWFGVLGYVILSGGGIATLRAFIMATLVMLAFMLGRNVLSLRTAAIAFLALILWNPYYVMSAGFQLSFASIFGIIWLWQNNKINTPRNKILKFFYTAVLTALVATIFTAAFVAMHFGTLPIYGLVGNLIFLPIFSFLLMPCIIIGTLGATIGIQSPLIFAHKIYDTIFDIAQHIAQLPSSNINIGNIPNTTIVFIIIGLGCAMFIINDERFKYLMFRKLNFLVGGTFIVLGILCYLFAPRPVFYISNDHKLIASVSDNGKLKFNKSKDSSNYFAFDTWKRMNGENTGTENLRLTKESGVYTISCKKWKLIYMPTFVKLAGGITTICQDHTIDYIASYFDISSEKCRNKILRGGGVIYDSGKFIPITSNRIWHNLPQ